MYRDFKQLGLQKSSFVPCGFIVKPPKDTALLNAIHTDEKGRPRDNIGVFKSEETSPEVRQAVSALMRERSGGEAIPNQMRNDDAIIDAMPNHGETLSQYEERVQSIVDSEKESIKSKKLEKQFKKLSEDLGLGS